MNRRALVVTEKCLRDLASRQLRFFLAEQDAKPNARSEFVFEEAPKYHPFEVPERVGPAKYTSVYFWGLYEYVLLQDQFVHDTRNDATALTRLPFKVAYHLFYERGQFDHVDTRVFPIIVDPLSLMSDEVSRGPERRTDGFQTWQPQSLADARRMAVRSFDEGGLWGALDDAPYEPCPAADRRWLELGKEGLRHLSEEVRKLVGEGTLQVWLVEDERLALKIPYQELGGTDFERDCNEAKAHLWLLGACQNRLDIRTFENPQDLTRDLDRLLELESKRRMLVLVVDILFESLRGETGLEIIRDVRHRFGEDVVLIVHTGYASPLVSRACHNAGADFVVQKGGLVPGSHAANKASASAGREPRIYSWTEVFWNVLSLQAAHRFGCAMVDQIVMKIESAWAEKDATFRGRTYQWNDLKKVFEPHTGVHYREHWRSSVLELFEDAAHLARAMREARGWDPELRKWKREILMAAKKLRGVGF